MGLDWQYHAAVKVNTDVDEGVHLVISDHHGGHGASRAAADHERTPKRQHAGV